MDENNTVGLVPEGAATTAASVAAVGPSWPVDYNAYKLIGKVGQGAFASVWRAECSNVPESIEKNGQQQDGIAGEGTETKEEVKMLCAIKILDLEHVDTNFGGELRIAMHNEFFYLISYLKKL